MSELDAPNLLAGNRIPSRQMTLETALVYLPVTEAAFPFSPERDSPQRELGWNTGDEFTSGSLPQDPKVKLAIEGGLKGHLSAWDPVARKEVWRAELGHPWNGGVVSTAGNLVFQGTGMGEFVAYRADNGERLWSAETQAGVLAGPISYEVDGDQYVAVEVGWGGAFGLAAGELALVSHVASNLPRVLVFKLGATKTLPPLAAAAPVALDPPADTAAAASVEAGKVLYHTYCSTCHGDAATGSGVLPDLRYSAYIKDSAAMDLVVRQGSRADHGMVAFKAEITSPQDWRASAPTSFTAPIRTRARRARRIAHGGPVVVAAIFARRHVVLGAEHAAEVRRAVEAVVEGNGGHGASALRTGLQRARAGLEPATQDVARHGLVLIREQMMQVARRSSCRPRRCAWASDPDRSSALRCS